MKQVLFLKSCPGSSSVSKKKKNYHCLQNDEIIIMIVLNLSVKRLLCSVYNKYVSSCIAIANHNGIQFHRKNSKFKLLEDVDEKTIWPCRCSTTACRRHDPSFITRLRLFLSYFKSMQSRPLKSIRFASSRQRSHVQGLGRCLAVGSPPTTLGSRQDKLYDSCSWSGENWSSSWPLLV